MKLLQVRAGNYAGLAFSLNCDGPMVTTLAQALLSTDPPCSNGGMLKNCDNCKHDDGRRVCAVVAHSTDTDLVCRTVAWVHRHCDDETLRPINQPTGCPGFDAKPSL